MLKAFQCRCLLSTQPKLLIISSRRHKSDNFSDISVVSDENPKISEASRFESPSHLDNRDDFFAKYPPLNPSSSREAFVETLSRVEDDSSNHILKLHPDIWAVRPRLDLLNDNLEWQRLYKRVDYDYQLDRHEMPLAGKKRPWPQKGMGKARHGTHRSPLWIQGGKCHPNRGPESHFYMLPYSSRVYGLIHTLSAKFAQDDVKFVNNLDIPSDEPKFIHDLIDARHWGLSTLFVDASDHFPRNLTAATMTILHVNMMPLYGLNVHDMFKHKTLVLTVEAAKKLEEKLLFADRRLDRAQKRVSASLTGQYV